MKRVILIFSLVMMSCIKGPLTQVQQSRHIGSFFGQWSSRVVLDSQLITDGEYFYYGTRQGKVFCVQAKNLRREWKHSFDHSVDTSVLVDDKYAYAGTSDGMLHALNKKTGKQVWEAFISAPARGNMTKVGDTVFVGTNDGELNAVSSADGKILWKYHQEPFERMKIQFFVQGSVDQKKLFVGFPNGQITALNIDTGEEIWKQWSTDAQARFYDIGSILLVPQKGILVTSVEGPSTMFSFEGQQLWSRNNVSTQSAAVLTGDQILIASKDELVWLDADGNEKATIAYPKSIRPAGVNVSKDDVFVTTLDGSLEVFDIQKSAIIWEYHMGVSIQGPPVVLNDNIWILNRRGQIIGMKVRK